MLVLSRRKNESVIIGGNIRITIVGIRNGKVRIGIEAPTEVTVHRLEIYNKLQEEQANNG